MHFRPGATEARLERMVRSRLRPHLHTHLTDVTVRSYVVGNGQDEPIAAQAVLGDPGALPWQDFPIGSAWGPAWGTCWFELTGQVPAEHRGSADLEVLLDLGWLDHSVGFQSEGLVYLPDGTIVKALNPRNAWIPLAEPGGDPNAAPPGAPIAVPYGSDGAFRCYVEAAANPLLLEVPPFELTWLGEKHTAGTQPLYTVARADLTSYHRDLAELVTDLEVAGELAAIVPDSDPRHARLLAAIDDALDLIDDQHLDQTIAPARAILARELAKPAHASAHQIWAAGHAHIDSAWLWPLRETKRKVARTVANQLALMDRNPDHLYVMSSAQQYAWLEQDYPQLFARIRERVAQGRFIPVGGMWVESDATMPSGESLVRQFTYGKRYFMDRFGIEPREVWLPDSFGYSGSLPQLARLAGFDYFLTQKISWSDTNAFPHHTFWWEGIDGSRIFTHFPPADTYSGQLTGEELGHAVANFRDKARSSHSLLPFGYGDGGGGPTREMLARARRWRDTEGAPQVRLAPPSQFFAAARAEYPAAPVWKGELYLELHRGTFTSQHATKRGNRRCETLLLQAERWAAAASLAGDPYPYDQLDEAWRTILLLQFHDILPGSSIGWVHREAVASYAAVESQLRELISRSGAALASAGLPIPDAGASCVPGPRPTLAPAGGGYVIDNGLVRLAICGDGEITSLRFAAGASAGTCDGAVQAPLGLDALGPDTWGPVAWGPELVAPGRGLAGLELYRDQPVLWDAWDIDADALRQPVTLPAPQVRPLESDGRVGAVVTRSWAAGAPAVGPDGLDEPVTHAPESGEPAAGDLAVGNLSAGDLAPRTTVELRIWVEPGSPQVHVDLTADWHECEKLLKLAFPVDLDCERAQFDTQFGYVTRQISRNTSWQRAQHEVCGGRYVRLVQGDTSVVIANDSSYGLSVDRDERGDGPAAGGAVTTARLSVLRAPRFPDPLTDQGTQHCAYVIAPAPTALEAVHVARRLATEAVCSPDVSEPACGNAGAPEAGAPGDGTTGGPAVGGPAAGAPEAAGSAGGPEAAGLRAPHGAGLIAAPDALPGLPVLLPGSTALIEAIKLADDRSGDLVMRIYEAAGAPTVAHLDIPAGWAEPRVTDLLERTEAPASGTVASFPLTWVPSNAGGGQASISLHGFAVATVRLIRL